MADRGLKGDLRWRSWHIYGLDSEEEALVHCVSPLMCDLRKRQIIRRWFFIRYYDSAPHLRIRIQTWQHSGKERSYFSELRQAISAARKPGVRLKAVSTNYCRIEHYFGENWTSVRSESLNVASTELAVILMSVGFISQEQRFLVACACLVLAKEQSIALWNSYTEFVAVHSGISASGSQTMISLSTTLHARLDRLAAEISGLSTVRRFLVRLRFFLRKGSRDLAMCSHALHLLVNKLGVPLRQEGLIVHTLSGAPR